MMESKTSRFCRVYAADFSLLSAECDSSLEKNRAVRWCCSLAAEGWLIQVGPRRRPRGTMSESDQCSVQPPCIHKAALCARAAAAWQSFTLGQAATICKNEVIVQEGKAKEVSKNVAAFRENRDTELKT